MITFLTSSIGRKLLMALTGVALIGFVIAHLLGNLQVFAGQDAFNAYADFLKGLGPALWLARIGLLVVFVVHIACAISLWRDNAAARPEEYRKKSTVQASAASLYMMQSGMVVLLFVIIHLLHFTLGALQPEYFELTDELGRHDVFSMLVLGFQSPGYVLFYVVAMCLLGLHLSHAISSCVQTIGLHGPRLTPAFKNIALVVSASIVLGYVSIPLAVLTGIVGLPESGGY